MRCLRFLVFAFLVLGFSSCTFFSGDVSLLVRLPDAEGWEVYFPDCNEIVRSAAVPAGVSSIRLAICRGVLQPVWACSPNRPWLEAGGILWRGGCGPSGEPPFWRFSGDDNPDASPELSLCREGAVVADIMLTLWKRRQDFEDLNIERLYVRMVAVSGGEMRAIDCRRIQCDLLFRCFSAYSVRLLPRFDTILYLPAFLSSNIDSALDPLDASSCVAATLLVDGTLILKDIYKGRHYFRLPECILIIDCDGSECVWGVLH
ncbi:hypothetical protein [Sediminispirochaeta smaragdinae]|uniref:Lipoprotein n=1 Tax=Sediminispirochaeta smaragdinae (strain DSM 11293 / JCM 15392 / SEBR 4228) TaxID=573413 RepID=E1RAE3_SEDSS|nr:hypothetical protein [Sediminispirochaeta smaragdinae]ADK79434.1 hypothetical protein Spirs_0278 [Sediminispirochaeta smaragdinae DSM 11293]